MASTLSTLFVCRDDNNDIIPVDVQTIEKLHKWAAIAFEARQKTINALYQTTAAIEELQRQQTKVNIGGGAISVTGAALGIAGGLITFLTAGAAALPIAGYLALSGTGCSVLGTAAKGMGSLYLGTGSAQSTLLDELKKAVNEDVEAHHALEEILMITLLNPVYENAEFGICASALGFARSATRVLNLVQCGIEGFLSVKKMFPTISEVLKGEKMQSSQLGSLLAKTLLPLFTFGEKATTAPIDAAISAAEAFKNAKDDAAKSQAREKLAEIHESVVAEVIRRTAVAAGDAALRGVLKRTGAVIAAELAAQTAAYNLAHAAAEAVVAQAAKKTAEEALEKALEEAAKKAAEAGLTMVSETAAVKVAQEGLRKASETAALKLAEASAAGSALIAARGASIATATGAVVKVVEEAGTAAAKEAAKVAAEQTAKTVAQVVGGVAVGFGALSLAWDTYSIYRDYKKRGMEDALRELAKCLEDCRNV